MQRAVVITHCLIVGGQWAGFSTEVQRISMLGFFSSAAPFAAYPPQKKLQNTFITE